MQTGTTEKNEVGNKRKNNRKYELKFPINIQLIVTH